MIDINNNDEIEFTTTCCAVCNTELYVSNEAGEVVEWIVGEVGYVDAGECCTVCAKAAEYTAWLAGIKNQIEEIAADCEWEISENIGGGVNTNSHYFELSRECGACILGKDAEECDCETLTIRVSDHSNGHGGVALSIVWDGKATDYSATIKDVLARK